MDISKIVYSILLLIEFMVSMWMLFPEIIDKNTIFKKKVCWAIPTLVIGITYALNGAFTPVSTGIVVISPLLISSFYFILNRNSFLVIWLWQLLYTATVFMFKLIVLMIEGLRSSENIIEVNYGKRSWTECIFEIILIIILIICTNLMRKKQIFWKQVCKKYWGMILFFSLIEFEMLSFLLKQSYKQINPYLFLVNIFIVISICIALGGVCLIYVNTNIKMEKSMIESHLKMFEELYSELLKQDREISKTNHNIHHEREYLLQLLSQKNISEAVRYIESKFKFSKEETIWTGFKSIDFIINRRKKIIDDNEIDFKMNTSLVRIPIPDSEFTILFGNLMDNALEAVTKCYKENRKIVLEIKNVGNIFILVLLNSSHGSKIMKNNQLYTTKTDKIIHGWGLKSVEAIVEKYHGDIKYDFNKDEFRVQIIFWN